MACWGAEPVWRETNLFGIYVSPLLVYILAAGVVFAPLRYLGIRLRLFRRLWNPPLAEMAMFICILGLLLTWL